MCVCVCLWGERETGGEREKERERERSLYMSISRYVSNLTKMNATHGEKQMIYEHLYLLEKKHTHTTKPKHI